MSKARISQCMIVKNEEADIERALSWGKGIVSEQIVVDTGSTDRTVEIARKMGAKVYNFQWIDDFAAAKNYAISKAKYEWIAFLDADEYFSPEDGRKLLGALDMLQMTGTESILTGWVNIDNTGKVLFIGTQQRIFRNLPTIRYQGRIHESLMTTDGHMLDTVDMVEELSIFHTGYGNIENSKKVGRNLKIIQEELEEKPDDYTMWGYLGQEYASRDQWDQAVEAFRRCVSLIPENMKGIYDITTSTAYYRLLETLGNILGKDEKTVMAVYEKAVEGWPEECDYDYSVGNYFIKLGNWEKAEYHLRRALELLEKYNNTNKGMALSGDIMEAYEWLATCCYHNGKLADCVQLASVLLKDHPYMFNTLRILLKAFSYDPETKEKGVQGATEVVGFLGTNFYDLSTIKDRLFILKAAMAADYKEGIAVLERMFTPQELQSIYQALHSGK